MTPSAARHEVPFPSRWPAPSPPPDAQQPRSPPPDSSGEPAPPGDGVLATSDVGSQAFTALLVTDDAVRQWADMGALSDTSFRLAHRAGQIEDDLLTDAHARAARVVGRDAASWAVLAVGLSLAAVLAAWLFPGGVGVRVTVGAAVWCVSKGLRFDVVRYVVAGSEAERRVARVVRDVDAHNASVRQVRVVARLREAGAEVDAALLGRAHRVLREGRERLVTALRVDRVLREEGVAGGALAVGSASAETLARDAADREAWLRRTVEVAEATLSAHSEIAAERRSGPTCHTVNVSRWARDGCYILQTDISTNANGSGSSVVPNIHA